MRISDWSSDVCSSDLVGRRQWAEDPLRILEPEQFALDGRGPFFAAVCQSIPDTGVQQHDMASRQGLDQLAIQLERMSPRPFMPGETKFRPHDSSADGITLRSEEHTSELQSLMSTSYPVFSLKKKK